jgi:hypothetical protein
MTESSRSLGLELWSSMLRRMSSLAAIAVLATAPMLASGCSSHADIRTVADFDNDPCALFTDDVMSRIVGPPYKDLASVDTTLKSSASSKSGGDTFACTYNFEAKNEPQVPQVRTMTVTVAHTKSGSQPYAICSAGAQTKASGYRSEKIGDGVCLSPSSDLWMKIGANYFHVKVVPQPGFTNPVEANQALSPLILTVAQGAADRMPKS